MLRRNIFIIHSPAFGSAITDMQFMNDTNRSYRYGFNNQEKDDEMGGKGDFNTAEYWEYNSRLGRRWNLDLISKLYLSNYSTYHNNPIIFIDPNGNDDYYNEFGEYLYTDTKLSNDIRIITQESWDRINLLYQRELFDNKKSYLNLLVALDENSKIATINIKEDELDKLWFDCFPKGQPRKEQNAVILLDLESDPEHPQIILERTPENKNRRAHAAFTYQKINGHNFYNGMPLLGAIHTHPNNESNNGGFGVTLVSNVDGDGAVALLEKIPIFNLYGPSDIEKNSKYISNRAPGIDMFHPIDAAKNVENICQYNDGQTLGEVALKANGANSNEGDTKVEYNPNNKIKFIQ